MPDIELNKIYNENCLDTMKRMPDNFLNLVVTSPPYNVNIDYGDYNDNTDNTEYYKWCLTWLKEIKRVLKKDGRFALNVMLHNAPQKNSPFGEYYIAAEMVGLNYKGIALWTDRSITKLTAWGSWLSASSPHICQPCEVIVFFYKDQWERETRGENTLLDKEFIESCSGIWNISPEKRDIHPAPFPIKLPEKCIRLLTYKNDLVYDPFMGSGTTAIPCIKWERNFIGSEISKEYCDIAEKRLKPYLQQTTLF